MGVSFNTNSNKNMQTLLCLTFAAVASFAQASKLDSIIQSKQAANSQIRAKRGILDPDAMCQGTLRNPSCWEEFAETVWKPTKIFSSLVSRKEGWPLYWCVKQCNTIDSARDLVGTAHEEKRKKNSANQCQILNNAKRLKSAVQNAVRRFQRVLFVLKKCMMLAQIWTMLHTALGCFLRKNLTMTT